MLCLLLLLLLHLLHLLLLHLLLLLLLHLLLLLLLYLLHLQPANLLVHSLHLIQLLVRKKQRRWLWESRGSTDVK